MNSLSLLYRDLHIPSYDQNGVASTSTVGTTQPKSEDSDEKPQNGSQQNAEHIFYTIYHNYEDIVYTPEDALKEGSGMVKTMKENLKKLELGSKLRREVWDREMAKLVNHLENCITLLNCAVWKGSVHRRL